MPDGHTETAFLYANVWARERTTGPDRLVIAPREKQVELLLALTTRMQAPFWLLYVLTVSRGEGKTGRYQSADGFDRPELANLLREYERLFIGDGRQNLWVASKDGGQLIYDKHNLIYAYGPLDAFAPELQERGFAEVDAVSIPSPHVHRYNEEFDSSSAHLLSEREWIHSPLRAQDDDRIVD